MAITEQILQNLINGLALGSVYALIALGYTMVYGVLKLINFAHGDVFMVGAFVGYFAANVFHLSLIPALICSMGLCALLGVLIERGAYRPLRQAPRIIALITAIGISFLLENLGIVLWGADPKSFPELFPLRTVFQWRSVTLDNMQLVLLLTSIVLMVVLQIIVLYTRVGKAMRAVSFDKDAAALMGVDVDRIISVTFALGSALAAAAGILYSLNYPKIEPLMGIIPGLKAFIAAVVGGIGNIPGAMVGGILMGIVEMMVMGLRTPIILQLVALLLIIGGIFAFLKSFAGKEKSFSRAAVIAAGVGILILLVQSSLGQSLAHFNLSTYRDAVAYVILILILLVKPSGILGRGTTEKV